MAKSRDAPNVTQVELLEPFEYPIGSVQERSHIAAAESFVL
jgi:hypothetical protein